MSQLDLTHTIWRLKALCLRLRLFLAPPCTATAAVQALLSLPTGISTHLHPTLEPAGPGRPSGVPLPIYKVCRGRGSSGEGFRALPKPVRAAAVGARPSPLEAVRSAAFVPILFLDLNWHLAPLLCFHLVQCVQGAPDCAAQRQRRPARPLQ